MPADARPFSHATNVTDYMRIVARRVLAGPAKRRILDIPAGSGKLAELLRAAGHDVVCADINREHPHYVYADMERALPFSDGEFDVAICLEGVEHLIDPVPLVRELTRVTRVGGEIIVSIPNVANFYSRLQFLLTGTFYQFNPAEVPAVAPGEMRDRGHITPLTYFQLRYLFGQFGARVKEVCGDRWKKKALTPLWLLLAPAAWLWSRALFLRAAAPEQARRNREMLSDSWRFAALFSRSLVLVFERQGS
ncbi:MAG TPA: class I SAM-dependent methyltransferase [Burkholderiales bacterium]|nr:class I SAM-dependent methyltransferase [Burkholderiales bacterium]